ncbi:MAG: chromosome segregation SMC family protein [Minisyncoccota bacterium]
MLLKRLELVGFKSFAEKTVLEFPGGIAGIVGPNGSGKSNVLDAVRWILGEREAKNLRGDKAEDLIFAGTQKRPRMGMAQVSLIFDNSSGFFAVDFSEVSIVRRIDRDGISQYFLNKAEVRLKDIIDFFAKARLGTHGLTVINQGESDLFVKSSPKERREMIEEVLGLRQYQIKKNEAQRKLKNTGINIDKVRVMLDEIAPHLRFLKKQTAKWEKLSETEKELNDLESVYFKNKLKEILIGLEKFSPRLKEIDIKLAQKVSELKSLQEQLIKVENSRPSNKAQLDTLQIKRDELLNKKSVLEKELGRLEVKIEFSSNTEVDPQKAIFILSDLKSVIKSLSEESDLAKIKSVLNEIFSKIDNFLEFGNEKGASKELAEFKIVKEKLSGQLDEIIKELENLKKMEVGFSADLEGFNSEFRRSFQLVETKKDEISGLESEKNRIHFDTERFNLRMQDLETQISQAGKDINEFKKDLSTQNNLDGAESINAFETERRIFKLRAEVASVGEIDQALLNEAKETETRFNFLSTQLADLEKASGDLSALIKDLDQKIHNDFTSSLGKINEEFNKFFQLMFGGGKGKLYLEKPEVKKQILPDEGLADGIQQTSKESEKDEEEDELSAGIELELVIPRKKIKGLEMLSGGEKSLVSIAVLFALISVSPPPFLVLDEVDAALDERNTKRFAELIKDFSKKSQFIIVTHNRSTMESSDVLYGVTMEEDGVSKVLSIKLD